MDAHAAHALSGPDPRCGGSCHWTEATLDADVPPVTADARDRFLLMLNERVGAVETRLHELTELLRRTLELTTSDWVRVSFGGDVAWPSDQLARAAREALDAAGLPAHAVYVHTPVTPGYGTLFVHARQPSLLDAVRRVAAPALRALGLNLMFGTWALSSRLEMLHLFGDRAASSAFEAADHPSPGPGGAAQ